MNKKIIIGIVAVVVIASVFIFLNLRTKTTELAVEVGEETQEVRPFRIVTLEWEPHAYTNEEGMVRGIAVDIMDLVFSRLNVSYEIRLIPWTRAMKEAETGESDGILLTAYAPWRDEFFYYDEEQRNYVRGEPIPHTASSISDGVFFVRKLVKEGIKFETLEDIREKGYRVGAVANDQSTGELHLAGIDVTEYPDDVAKFQGLADGVVDIALVDKAIAVPILKRMGLADEMTYFPQSFFRNPLYMPFSKKSDYPNLPELREQIFDELRKIHESGEFDEIYNKYIGE